MRKGLERVSSALRERLEPNPEDIRFTDQAVAQLNAAIERLVGIEEMLLPPKKRRALSEMRLVLRKYHDVARRVGDRQRQQIVREVLDSISPSNREDRSDLNAAAEWWLAQIRPVWLDNLLKPRRTRPALLQDIRQALIDTPLSTTTLATFTNSVAVTTPMHKRVIVTIVGLPSDSGG